MVDRVFRGAISGIVAGLIMNIWSYISYSILHITTLRFIDWAAILINGTRPVGLVQDIFALFLHFIWVSFLGVVFALLVPYVTSRGYILKGLGYSWITGFLMYSVTTMFQVPSLYKAPFNTTVSNFIGAAIWGIGLAVVLKWLENKTSVSVKQKLHRFAVVPAPAKKDDERRVKLKKPIKIKK